MRSQIWMMYSMNWGPVHSDMYCKAVISGVVEVKLEVAFEWTIVDKFAALHFKPQADLHDTMSFTQSLTHSFIIETALS